MARTVNELEIADLKADTVITIENKASYREYCRQMDELWPSTWQDFSVQ